MNFDFSDGENLLPKMALSYGPDVLRPGSAISRFGQGQTAFFYTRYPSESGKRLFAFSASDGHEKHITEPEILKAMFGPNLAKIEPEITYTRMIYGDKEVGTKKDYDHQEVRRYAMKENLIGRYGQVKGIEALMLWGIPESGGWQMVSDVIDQLPVGKDARIVNGTSELGPVWKFQEQFKEGTRQKKDMPVDQDTERIQALQRYHIATGAEKERLKKQFGFTGNQLQYPSPDDNMEKYPWKRGHWRMKAKQVGLPDPFDYGEVTLGDFSKWLLWLESKLA